MIGPFVTNELAKALVEDRLREAERARLARAARMRRRSNRTWVSWWSSRFAHRIRAMRLPQPARGFGDDMRTRTGVAAPARIRPEQIGTSKHE